MKNPSKGRRLALASALSAAVLFAPACATHRGHGYSNSYWYEDVGVVLVAAAVFVLAACSGGHGHYHGHFGHSGHGYHGGWHR